MRLKPGDQLRCTNPECRFQVVVTDLGAYEDRREPLRCSCGYPMKRPYVAPAASKLTLSRSSSHTDERRGPHR